MNNIMIRVLMGICIVAGMMLGDPARAVGGVTDLDASRPSIKVSPASRDFGAMTVGKTESAKFRIKNKGKSILSIDEITIEGADEGVFSMVSDGCSGRSLEASQGCSVKAAFAPTSIGSKSAQMQIPYRISESSTIGVNLSGVGVAGKCKSYTQKGGTVTKSDQSYCGKHTDESAVKVTDSGIFNLADSVVTSSGDTSSPDDSSFYGLNAGVLATSGSTIDFSNCGVNTTGTGANGVFATGTGTSITLTNVTIHCTGQLGHGVDATLDGTLTLNDVDINTTGANAAAIATDRGGGTITVSGGSMTTSGADSPGIYSTGAVTVSGASIKATGSEGAVIEGENSIILTNTTLTGEKKRGVMIYQSMSGDAEGIEGTFTMTGGSLSATIGPLFYVTNSTGIITLTGVTVSAGSGTLVNAAAGDWGTPGSNGGKAIFTADGQTLTGDLITDRISSIKATLKNGTSLTGYINKAALTLDATSSWHVTENSTLTILADQSALSDDTITNIYGYGHTVYYNANLEENSWLDSKTYHLNGGGYLTPK